MAESLEAGEPQSADIRACLWLYNCLKMRILGRQSLLRVAVLFLACPLGFGEKCSNPILFLNSVGQDLMARRDIRAEDLDVTVDGKRTQVVSFSLNSGPRRIIMMVDTSGSMHASPQRRGWGIALRTAAFAFNSVPSNASVALLTFGDRLRGQTDGFQDRPKVASKVLDLAKQEPQGQTALFDSIDQALSLFQAPQLGDAIYLVTDGGDNKSKVSPKTLREELIAHGVRVFVFLVPIEEPLTVEEREGPSLVGDLAAYTGGYVVRISWHEIGADEQAWAQRAATKISGQVQSMYQMELDISSVGSSKGRVKAGFAGRKRGNDTLAYPRQLVPCAPVP